MCCGAILFKEPCGHSWIWKRTMLRQMNSSPNFYESHVPEKNLNWNILVQFFFRRGQEQIDWRINIYIIYTDQSYSLIDMVLYCGTIFPKKIVPFSKMVWYDFDSFSKGTPCSVCSVLVRNHWFCGSLYSQYSFRIGTNTRDCLIWSYFAELFSKRNNK